MPYEDPNVEVKADDKEGVPPWKRAALNGALVSAYQLTRDELTVGR